VSAKGGEERAVLSVAGGGVLQRRSSAAASGGLVWCRGEQPRAAAAASVSLHSGQGQREHTKQRWMRRCGAGQAGQGRFPPRTAGSAVTSETFTWKISQFRCSMECPQDLKIRIFEILKFDWSLYWIGILKQFLSGRGVVYCENLI
jgi:hypothetical protein